ncbi:hypothetical protein J6O48_06470 [bacterium]|nr:hypothetical protein [bacterium]
MIDRIRSNQLNNIQVNNQKQSSRANNSPNFKGGIVDMAVKGIQMCEKNPMLNVAVIDVVTAIGPRSIWESFTNIFAGFEALRRESSGLIVNCLIPGFVALGAAKAVNKYIMGDKADLSGCWAGSDTINAVADYYKDAEGTEAYKAGLEKYNDAKKARVYATHYNMLSDAKGVDGDVTKSFKDIKEFNISETAEKLTEATFEEKKHLTFAERLESIGNSIKNIFTKNKTAKKQNIIKNAFEDAASKTHITENITFGTGEKAVKTGLKSAMENSTGILRGLVADGAENAEQISQYAKKAKKLVNTKGAIAMAIIIPLAASMQSINRWITTRMSGVKGAPIYNDYGKNEEKIVKTPEEEKAEKKALLKQKFISVGSMIGVACLSMMKLPSLGMLKNVVQFKGQFPTMDQARAISTVTFGSRMAVADDKNELAEATTRDIVTFSSMYFLGDYAAKGYATYLENKHGVKLLNREKPLPKDANIFKKFGNWIVNTHLKSTDELVADGVRSLEDMKTLRNKCQLANIGSALMILGLMVPVYTRLKTEKNHKKELLANEKRAEAVNNPQNVKENVTISKQHGNYNFSGTFNNMNTCVNNNKTFQSFRQIAQERK